MDEFNAMIYGSPPLVRIGELMEVTATLVVVIFVPQVRSRWVQIHPRSDPRDRVMERDVNWQSNFRATDDTTNNTCIERD